MLQLLHVPNLFDYATSELSQDAALCYFLSYGAPQYEGGPHASEHQFARVLLRKMFEICGKVFPTQIEKVDVRKQYRISGKYLDILVQVNDIYVAIEDKRQAQDHSDQLSIYSEIHKPLGVSTEDVLLMYMQTGNQANLKNIESANFKLMSRSMLLSLFETEAGRLACSNSKIHRDFHLHFLKLEDQYRNFGVIDITKWETPSQIGFLEALIARNKGEWAPAGGGGGGFRAYRGPVVQVDNACAYLQVEASNNEEPQIHLRFKVDVPRVSSKEEYIAAWDQWHKRMMDAAAKSPLRSYIAKPHRATPTNFNRQNLNSHSLLVAKIDDGQNWKTSRIFPSVDSNSLLALDPTLATLKDCQTILESLRG
ncbi:PD-(D/E)XK nuclease family protein [Paraburkholderia diazotrophica]|uniref:PD-(D/E)XK nuclease superfamily protein n=1 Tax=Paraburkholderia diazotrophica TaxID=667676 RepID=A0A1H7CPK3_9BURK|nr:PD-(D/E)XK nuclease family protein [Paraburkholderia diazotrophica]SEJ91154.1 PD-(D/E)XK nuclease superfamily protein [Paraburkholderia diazotrophica]